MKYDPHVIEKKWCQIWKEKNTYLSKEEPHLPKYYILDMFPYPSGAGLHVGHLIGYTATDIIARYKRALGFSVLHPMGWDSFGLPAEQYAIRTGTHPAITTQKNIANFKEQMQKVGFSYDWERELATSDPSFYRWTQWIFTKLYEKGLAYQGELLVNWCPELGTVLANEEIENGKSKEGGHPIERRPLKQWVLKITAYAEQLLNDLDELDWPDGLKRLQRNWIGKSEGAEINFSLENCTDVVKVFTTRPDTLFGVSYLVLSPEHPLLKTIVSKEQEEEVRCYQKKTSEKSDLERTELAEQKTGVFTGAYALHPATGQRIPIWTADYVLMSYATGAIMGVPAHDERDCEFAKLYQLPILPVVQPPTNVDGCWTGEGICINSGLNLNGLTTHEAKKQVCTWLEETGIGKKTVTYKLRDWLFSRQRYWGEPIPILHFEDGTMRALDLDELPLLPPEVTEYKPTPSGESPLAKVKNWVDIEDAKVGKKAKRETNTMPQWAGSCWYYLRFCDPKNQQAAWDPIKEKYWMPVDLYVGGAEHAVLHLLYSRFWHKVLYDCGYVSTREPFKKLVNQGLVVAKSYQKSGGAYVAPEEVTMREGKYYHTLTGEPLRSQIEKMSKSKLNGISPDEILEEFGADALRLYSMFMGPIDKEKVWNTDGVGGCRRFLNRFYDMATSPKVQDIISEQGARLVHKLIAGVTADLDELLLNTAIAKMMEFLNEFTKLNVYPKEAVLLAIQLLAPFAPHMAEELWEWHGKKNSVYQAPWPKADPQYLIEETVIYVVQVNGKVRARFEFPKGSSQEMVTTQALKDAQVAKHLQSETKKVIFVPDKLINFVL